MELPGSSATVATLVPYTTSAVVAVAEAKVRITRRHWLSISTETNGRPEGGLSLTSVWCRQKSASSEVLTGGIFTGKAEPACGFRGKSDASPGLLQEIATPIKTPVILLLGPGERTLKGMHGTPFSRTSVRPGLNKTQQKAPQQTSPGDREDASKRQKKRSPR